MSPSLRKILHPVSFLGGSIPLTLAHGSLSFQHFPDTGKGRTIFACIVRELIGWSQAVVPRAMALEFLNRASVSKQTCNSNICQHLNTGFTKQRLWKLTHLFQSKQTNDRLGLLGCTSVLPTFPRTAFNKKAASRWDCFHFNRLLGWNWHF